MGYAPALTVSGADVKIDWSKYDARLGKYLDGSAFTGKYGYNGPGYGVPIEFLMLPFDAYPMNLYKLPRGIQKNGKEYKFYAAWPVSLPKEGRTPEYQQIWTNTFQRGRGTFRRASLLEQDPVAGLFSEPRRGV